MESLLDKSVEQRLQFVELELRAFRLALNNFLDVAQAESFKHEVARIHAEQQANEQAEAVRRSNRKRRPR